MKCRYYTPDDEKSINMWYHERNMEVVPAKLLPPIGFVVPGIACAHLYQTDGGIAILENFISNPHVSRDARVEALDTIIEALTEEAKKLGFKMVMALSTHPTINEGCRVHKFEDIGVYRMFSKEIK